MTGTPPNVTYTPYGNYNGFDSFGFKVVDGFGTNNDTGLVTINVTPVNDPPTATNVSANTTEDNATSVLLVATDLDGDALTYAIASPPTKGVLGAVSDNSVSYTPNANENGVDTFTFTATDPSNSVSSVATATVNITIGPSTRADRRLRVRNHQRGHVGRVALTGSDVEPGPLTFGIVNQPVHGTLSGSLPNVSYTPTAHYNGPDTFVFKVSDSNGAPDLAIIHLEVAAVNDVPTASNASVSTNQDTPVTVSMPRATTDGDTLTYTPTHRRPAPSPAPAMAAPTRRRPASPARTRSPCSSTTATVALRQ